MKVSANSLQEYDRQRKAIFYPKTDVAEHAALYRKLASTREHDLAASHGAIIRICIGRWGSPPISITPISSAGTFHLLYKIYYNPEESYIIRLNRLPEQKIAWEFLLEQWLMPHLASKNLSQLKVIAIDLTRSICPTDYQIVSYAMGKALNAFEDPETQYMSPELLRAVGEYVARVHETQLQGFGPLALTSLNTPVIRGVHDSWRDYIMLRLHEHVEICQHIGAITLTEATQITKIFDQSDQLLYITKAHLLHGDLGNHNFLSEDGCTISALIDWEDCMAGDSVFDIAFWGTFFKDHMLDDFLQGYERVTPIPQDFKTRYWLYYLRIALSKTVHRYYFGYGDKVGRVPASVRIQKALKRFCQ